MPLLNQMVKRNEKMVILTVPENVKRLQEEVGDRLVLSIQEAKGLEFPEVAIVDFFLSQDQNKTFQQAWNLLLVQGANAATSTFQACPEMEGKLKLLYTGESVVVSKEKEEEEGEKGGEGEGKEKEKITKHGSLYN